MHQICRCLEMDYDKINLKIQLFGEIFAIPCSMKISPDGDKLVLVFKQEDAGAVKELRDKIIQDGKRYE